MSNHPYAVLVLGIEGSELVVVTVALLHELIPLSGGKCDMGCCPAHIDEKVVKVL